MFKLFSVLKDRSGDQQATAEELEIASGKKMLDPEKAKEWFSNLDAASQNIHQAFQKQAEVAAVRQFKKKYFPNLHDFVIQSPWDQVKFEGLITEWIVGCNQTFDEVEKPEFREMLTYAHHPSPTLKIPHRNAIKRRIMQMGEDTVESTKAMFKVLSFFF